MGILIDSDTKMPSNCHECFAGLGGLCFVIPSWVDEDLCPDEGKPDWCPLREVQDDANEAFEKHACCVRNDKCDIIRGTNGGI